VIRKINFYLSSFLLTSERFLLSFIYKYKLKNDDGKGKSIGTTGGLMKRETCLLLVMEILVGWSNI